MVNRYLKGHQAPEEARPPAQPQPKQQPSAAEQSNVASFSAGRWYAGKERGTKLSQSRVLTEREMEMIELGGAPP